MIWVVQYKWRHSEGACHMMWLCKRLRAWLVTKAMNDMVKGRIVRGHICRSHC
jgi:hypothetical protein